MARLRDLGTIEAVQVGTRVAVEEHGILYIAVGNTTSQITQRLGWMQANVWMPEHILRAIVAKRGWIIVDPVAAASLVLANPVTVRNNERPNNAVRFIADATELRRHHLLRSASTRYVDTLVELREVPDGNLLRLFHLSPRSKNQGGEQLWP